MSYVLGLLCIIGVYSAIAQYNNLNYKLTSVYKICPVLIIEDVNNILLLLEDIDNSSEGFLGGRIGPIVVLYEEGREDENVLIHELTHAKQAYKKFFILDEIMYRTNSEYRLLAEYEAFKSEKNPFRENLIVDILHMDYNLDMTRQEIIDIIKNKG